ncbi:hypothetical protein G816_00084 [Escherichia coli HVH 158 (4-3224287)]|nr:hypothetical protein G816_00084 [Escherichia coli HVH 158 (4-3224287)]
MLRWKRCIILTFISGAAFAAPEINVKQNESLPDLGSQAAQQDEQTNKGKSLKERGADYVINSATQGFENLTPEALESQARSYLQSQITSTAQSILKTHSLPTVRSVRTSPLVRAAIWMAVPSIILFPGTIIKPLFISANFLRNEKKIVRSGILALG